MCVYKGKWRGLGVERPESRGVADGNLGQKLGNTGKKPKEQQAIFLSVKGKSQFSIRK